MYLRFRRTLSPWDFASKHPRPHLIVAHYDPLETEDEDAIGPVTYRTALSVAMNGLDLAGECTDLVDAETSTIQLCFELGSDAAKVCQLVQATPAKSRDDMASTAEFTYDFALFQRLRDAMNAKKAAIKAAYDRGEDVVHVHGVLHPDEDEPGPIADDWGSRAPMTVLGAIPLRSAGG